MSKESGGNKEAAGRGIPSTFRNAPEEILEAVRQKLRTRLMALLRLGEQMESNLAGSDFPLRRDS